MNMKIKIVCFRFALQCPVFVWKEKGHYTFWAITLTLDTVFRAFYITGSVDPIDGIPETDVVVIDRESWSRPSGVLCVRGHDEDLQRPTDLNAACHDVVVYDQLYLVERPSGRSFRCNAQVDGFCPGPDSWNVSVNLLRRCWLSSCCLCVPVDSCPACWAYSVLICPRCPSWGCLLEICLILLVVRGCSDTSRSSGLSWCPRGWLWCRVPRPWWIPNPVWCNPGYFRSGFRHIWQPGIEFGGHWIVGLVVVCLPELPD